MSESEIRDATNALSTAEALRLATWIRNPSIDPKAARLRWNEPTELAAAALRTLDRPAREARFASWTRASKRLPQLGQTYLAGLLERVPRGRRDEANALIEDAGSVHEPSVGAAPVPLWRIHFRRMLPRAPGHLDGAPRCADAVHPGWLARLAPDPFSQVIYALGCEALALASSDADARRRAAVAERLGSPGFIERGEEFRVARLHRDLRLALQGGLVALDKRGELPVQELALRLVAMAAGTRFVDEVRLIGARLDRSDAGRLATSTLRRPAEVVSGARTLLRRVYWSELCPCD